MTEEERAELLADEWLIVRHSGEIPEITFHSSLYYLTKDKKGAGLQLGKAENNYLKDAAVQRYHEIILRDVQLENFHKTIYRGVRRSIYNWHRYLAFCARQSLDCAGFSEILVLNLLSFLSDGIAGAGDKIPSIFVNCSIAELQKFAEELQIDHEQLPSGIAKHCQQDD